MSGFANTYSGVQPDRFLACDVRSLLTLADDEMYEHRRQRDARGLPVRRLTQHA